MRGEERNELEDADSRAEDESGPWAKTSSGDADSVTEESDDERDKAE
jgi:hypothetical protein